jgi:hypothetical protein
MAKRFSATEIWDEDWFLDMPDHYKLFWFYMLAKCDHAGIFRVNITKFNRATTENKQVNATSAITYFNTGKERIRVLTDSKWFIEDFFVFQYGTTLNKNSKVHQSIENLYNQHNINLTSIRGLSDLKERVIDKDKDKVKDKEKYNNGEISKILKGRKFDEIFEKVYFEDESWQLLGREQKILAETSCITPSTIIKGSIY